MKKAILVAIVGMSSLFANNATAQAVEQGNVIIDAYYGFPNLYTNVFKVAYANSGTELNLAIGGIGPLGGRVEYMVGDKLGLGLDVGFNNSTIKYQEVSSSDGQTYDYDFKTQKLGFMVTFNWHFLENNDNLDVYGVLGAGYGNRTFEFTSTDPNYNQTEVKSLIPIASKIGVGMRYFFTDNIGANLALGFGQGGILNAGISAKF